MEVRVGDYKSAEHATTPSPLRPLRRSLAVLKFIGFPLRFSDDPDDVLRNKRWFGAVIFVQGSVSLNWIFEAYLKYYEMLQYFLSKYVF